MFRRLLIWIMLFALPLQGFAAVGMIHCTPGQHGHTDAVVTQSHLSEHQHVADAHSAEDTAHHDHADVVADTDSASQETASGSSNHSHHPEKATCCAGGVLALTTMPSVTFFPQDVSVSPPYSSGFWATVFLEAPKRPPRPFLA